MSSLGPYPTYEPSGVDWLGDIPADWTLMRAGYLFKRKRARGFSDEELLSVYRDYGVVPKASRNDNFNKPSEDLSSYQLVDVGDLVLNKMKTWQGSIAVSEYRGIVSPAYLVCSPVCNAERDRVHPKFVHHLLRSPIYIAQYLRYSKGIRVNQWDLDFDDFKSIEVLLPPLREQVVIASFLEHELGRIDALIARQERLLELLQEKRQAVISHAVTKGLDPSVPMKDSGVEWIGSVPTHWTVPRLKHVAKLESGHTPSRSKPEYWEDCYIPWVSLSDVGAMRSGREVYVHETKEAISDLGLANSAARLLPAGTVVLSRTASVGYSAILSKPMATTQDFVNWICGEQIVPEYLYLVFQSMKPEFQRLMMGSTHQTIYMPDVREFATPLPPKEEQSIIVDEVFARRERFDFLSDKALRSIELLRERRTALISAAVTGQIDVRDWKPSRAEEAA